MKSIWSDDNFEALPIRNVPILVFPLSTREIWSGNKSWILSKIWILWNEINISSIKAIIFASPWYQIWWPTLRFQDNIRKARMQFKTFLFTWNSKRYILFSKMKPNFAFRYWNRYVSISNLHGRVISCGKLLSSKTFLFHLS